jgi:diaminohydroxyphosphoribosylaminopyrimidine deaminase / 5-amino-6-(5-phosphoribosylamino)uracil reductase
MFRALELAVLGKGSVSPNPLVGCVIVHENRIIGEGWHKQYGDWHAEINALNSVENKSLLPESTVYVTLEPCSHFGKTPPCADRLVQEQVKKVIIANPDPFPLVNGRGIEKLRNAGIEVQTGCLEAEGRELNKRFFTFLEKKRPYITLKWAETADGFLAGEDRRPQRISNDFSQIWVHKMRAEEDAILVGTNTALYDNPQLNIRHWTGKNPVRVLIDKHLRLPETLYLFDKTQPTLCYNLLKNEESENLTFIQLPEPDFLQQIILDLYQRKIQSLVVEGGSQLLSAFQQAGLWDEAWVFKSEKIFSKGLAAPAAKGALQNVVNLEGNRLFRYKNPF